MIGCGSAGLMGLYTNSGVRVEAAMKLLDALLGLCFPDVKIPPKIRRHAHSCTIGLLSGVCNASDVIGDAIGGYIGVLLQGMCDASNDKGVEWGQGMQILGFVRGAVRYLPVCPS